ncbi:rhamnogalacturonan acetylesterase [Clostridium sp. SHJSY1]|nr:rhamnogalacturonan acetylesterase [Clostridium sp. SHJSY1]
MFLVCILSNVWSTNVFAKEYSNKEKNAIPNGKSVNIYLAGDSTVKSYGPTIDTGGWGEFLQSYFNSSKVTIRNYANGGRSSRSFINEGSLDKIASNIKSGDYLLIQFGHNDSANQPKYVTERFVSVGQPDKNGIYPSIPAVKGQTPEDLVGKYGDKYYPYTSGTYKWYLKQYIDVARKVGATPILVTSVSRQYFNADGTIKSLHDSTDTTTGTVVSSKNAYVNAVKQLGKEQGVKVIDMFSDTKSCFETAYRNDPAAANGISPLAREIMDTNDLTHNNKIGGFYNSALIANEIQKLGYNISNYVIPPVNVNGINSKNNLVFKVDSKSKVSIYKKNSNGVYTNDLDTYWTGKTKALINKISSTAKHQ